MKKILIILLGLIPIMGFSQVSVGQIDCKDAVGDGYIMMYLDLVDGFRCVKKQPSVCVGTDLRTDYLNPDGTTAFQEVETNSAFCIQDIEYYYAYTADSSHYCHVKDEGGVLTNLTCWEVCDTVATEDGMTGGCIIGNPCTDASGAAGTYDSSCGCVVNTTCNVGDPCTANCYQGVYDSSCNCVQPSNNTDIDMDVRCGLSTDFGSNFNPTGAEYQLDIRIILSATEGAAQDVQIQSILPSCATYRSSFKYLSNSCNQESTFSYDSATGFFNTEPLITNAAVAGGYHLGLKIYFDAPDSSCFTGVGATVTSSNTDIDTSNNTEMCN